MLQASAGRGERLPAADPAGDLTAQPVDENDDRLAPERPARQAVPEGRGHHPRRVRPLSRTGPERAVRPVTKAPAGPLARLRAVHRPLTGRSVVAARRRPWGITWRRNSGAIRGPIHVGPVRAKMARVPCA